MDWDRVRFKLKQNAEYTHDSSMELNELRVFFGVNGARIAEELNIAHTSVKHYLSVNGKNMSKDQVKRLYDCVLDLLVDHIKEGYEEAERQANGN